jgi:hypothetical protein
MPSQKFKSLKVTVGGNPYRMNTFFVGRHAEIAAVHDHLATGRSTLLIGGRRTGKTFLTSKLPDIGRPLLLLDAGAWKLDSEADVLNEIGAGLDQFTGQYEIDRPYTRGSLVERLKQIGQIAIVIDEADRMLSEPWAASFLSYLRWIDDHALRSLIAFLLIGGPSLSEYRNPDDHGSPPLNTADPVYLEPLNPLDVSKMIVNLPTEVSPSEVMQWAGGHPWLINRLLADVWDGKEFQEAIDHVWDISVRNFKVWHRQIGEEGIAFLKVLPSRGLDMSEFRTGKMVQHREALLKCRYTCLVQRGERGTYQPGPKLFLDWLLSNQVEPHKWDIAISYASEDVNIARSIYSQLSKQLRVFFAPAEDAYMWGQDLNKALPNTYGVDSRFVLVLSSESYVRKHWTQIEFSIALNSLSDGHLLVVNFGKLPPDMPPNLVFMDASPANLVGLIENIRRKLEKQ